MSVTSATFQCPRCLAQVPLRPGTRFCPRCGLADAPVVAADRSPLEVPVGGRTYRVLDRLAVGSVGFVYRCRFNEGGREVEGVFKIARDARSNSLVANEATALRHLHAADGEGRFGPFLPRVEASFALRGEVGTPARQANVLRMHEAVRSPDEFFTLAEVRAHYRDGLGERHAAWIWRRLLTVLGFVHASDVVHSAVLPMHVLVEPREHKLLLVDWCCAVAGASARTEPPTILTGGHVRWYKRETGTRSPPTPALDVAFAARCMIDLLGGDPVTGELPPKVDPALHRYFSRCLAGGSGAKAGAWKLLDDFDQLIAALWGRRTFHVLDLPPKPPPPGG